MNCIGNISVVDGGRVQETLTVVLLKVNCGSVTEVLKGHSNAFWSPRACIIQAMGMEKASLMSIVSCGVIADCLPCRCRTYLIEIIKYGVCANA